MNIDYGIAFMKGPFKSIKVTLSTFRSTTYAHIREYMWEGDDEIWIPTPKGIALPAEEVDSVIALLQKASQQLAKPYELENQLEFDFGSSNE